MSMMSQTVIPKSDQLNYDDFITGKSKTIIITKITFKPGDQPCIVNYEGDNGKPYKPNKSMRRVMVRIWGEDDNKYIGRSMILFGEPTVRFGADEVGGILISHMSHIDKPMTVMLTKTRANKRPFTVQPLKAQVAATSAVAKPVEPPKTNNGPENQFI